MSSYTLDHIFSPRWWRKDRDREREREREREGEGECVGAETAGSGEGVAAVTVVTGWQGAKEGRAFICFSGHGGGWLRHVLVVMVTFWAC